MYFIAIDGGGTKTDGVLFRRDGTVLSHCVGGASCPTSIGVEHAASVLTHFVINLVNEAGLSCDEIKTVYAGVAGCGIAKIGNCLSLSLKSWFPSSRNVACGSDVTNALNCGIYSEDGMALVCGTGSALLVRSGDKLRQIGGWGYLLGDEGSGFDLGKMAFKAALRFFDGCGEKTVLYELMSDKMMCPIQEAIDLIYSGGKRYIASFAPVLFDAIQENDTVAWQILKSGAGKLRKMLEAGCRYLDPAYRVVLVGGMWDAGDGIYQRMVFDTLDHAFVSIRPNCAPVVGAAIQALHMAGQQADDCFISKICEELRIRKGKICSTE